MFGSEGVTSSLAQGGPEQRILASKDRGLRPLLRQVQGWVNRWIIHPIAPDLAFEFVGLDAETEASKLQADKERVAAYMTINEVRASNGLEPLEKGGDIILNQTYVTAMSMAEGAGDEGMGAEGEEPVSEEPEEGDDFEGGAAEEEGDEFTSEEPPLTKSRKVRVSVEL